MKTSIKTAVLALVLALALPAAAAAKTQVYGGTINGTNGTGKIAFTVKTNKKGKPKAVKSFRFTNLPLTCETTPAGKSTGAGAAKGKIPVINRKFSGHYFQNNDPQQPRTDFDGKFKGKRKLKGSLDYNWHYPEDPELGFPEEDCWANVTYKAKRGGPDVKLRPHARTR